MRVLVFLTFGVSFKSWEQSGLLDRELKIYKYIKKKYKVHFTFVSFGNEDDIELAQGFEVIPYYKYNMYRKSKYLTFLQSFIFSYRLNKYVDEFDLIKTNQLLGSWMAIIYKLKHKKPLIVRTGYDIYRFSVYEKKPIFKRIFYYILTQISLYYSNIYIVTSLSDKKFLKEKYQFSHKKVVILPNWVIQQKNKEITPMIHRYKNRILVVGRLEKQKNFEQLLKIFSNTDYVLDIIGSGSQRFNLEKISSELNLNINFVGKLSHTDLLEEYKKYRVLVSTSLYEGNSKTTLEAMASGCLVIVTNIENNSEIISNNVDGLLHNFLDLYELVNININNLNKLTKFQRASLARVETNNSIEVISKKEFEIYKGLN